MLSEAVDFLVAKMYNYVIAITITGGEDMGQYYDVLNLDKKELLDLEDLGCAKLWDYYKSFEYECAIINLLADKWKGDNVILLGDYCDNAEESSAVYNMVMKIRNDYHYDGYMQDYPEEFESIEYDRSDRGYRYVYNHSTKQFLDYNRILHSDCVPLIYPLVLLLAVGNGYGNGDYHRNNENLVGSWALTSAEIEVSKELLPLYGYSELIPDFHWIK